jgi:hypothetical protein
VNLPSRSRVAANCVFGAGHPEGAETSATGSMESSALGSVESSALGSLESSVHGCTDYWQRSGGWPKS